MSNKLSVIIITKNEERNIERCLQSVHWADEIIVVDDFSSDKTVEIAHRLNAKIIQKEWMGFAKQKEFALQQASHEWVFSLDADEEATESLKSEIRALVDGADTCEGYEIPRKSFFLGKWIEHSGWYPGYQLRLFQKSKTRMNHRPVHEGFLIEGKTGKLQSPLNHYTYHSIHQYIEKMNDYTSLDVMNKISNGKKISWLNFILNPLSVFLRMFFSLQGYKDGIRGFLLAYYSSFSALVLYAKCWEYQYASKFKEPLPPVSSTAIGELKKLSS